MRIGVRLAVFAVVLAAAFGGAYAIGDATESDSPAPVTTEHDMDGMDGVSDHSETSVAP